MPHLQRIPSDTAFRVKLSFGQGQKLVFQQLIIPEKLREMQTRASRINATKETLIQNFPLEIDRWPAYLRSLEGWGSYPGETSCDAIFMRMASALKRDTRSNL